MSAAYRPAAPIPVTVLTGFLGSGKTTLLNRLLADPLVRDVAVIVNEFGEVGIDHLLVETAGEGLIELSDGCVCCTVRGELVDTLADLVDRVQTGRLKALARVVIETTGLADPTPILASLMAHPVLVQHFSLDGVVVLVDAMTGAETLRDRREAQRQVACADRIVMTKSDLLAPTPPLLAEIRRLNPRAPIIEVTNADSAALFGCGLIDAETRRADLARWLGPVEAEGHGHGHRGHDHHHHHHGEAHAHGAVRSFSLRHEAPIALADVEGFLDLLRMREGERLLRMKAVVRTREDEDRPLVLHGVRTYLHPPVRLSAWPVGEPRGSRLVLIGEGLDETLVRDLFAAFAGAPRLDAPDRAALVDNPLALHSRGF
ncbi:GTP-binding protein [Aureimonas sp. AU12]|uniref:CobW family GTP-binding protein n=1 Tax=Aureimonas sp. AU12 TaxID=1638161 RepID=UPI0007863604|nr:GTP-binding protein [Aureimonas sp. AU12]